MGCSRCGFCERDYFNSSVRSPTLSSGERKRRSSHARTTRRSSKRTADDEKGAPRNGDAYVPDADLHEQNIVRKCRTKGPRAEGVVGDKQLGKERLEDIDE